MSALVKRQWCNREVGEFPPFSVSVPRCVQTRFNPILFMNKLSSIMAAFSICAATCLNAAEPQTQARNPIIHADVPDIAMIRVGDTYYMSSTTMHMSPGLPIMKSKDLVNWELVSYAYYTLADNDALTLRNGRNAYGAGSWASSLRYHRGTFYVTTFSSTSGQTHVYRTRDIEKGPWIENTFRPSLHDHSLFFDDDGRVYMLYGGGNLRLVELNEDLSGLKEGGFNQVVITNAHGVVTANVGLVAEGSQLIKVNGKYYVFNICWPRGGMRTVVIHRADKITGPWEGRLGLQDKGVAQGCIIDTPTGEWFAYLFRDFGAVGRIPYLVPMKWEDGWPVIGVDGKVPDALNLPASKGLIPGIVASDEFDRKAGEPALPLVWQWNHNPDNKLWSLTQRPGFLRLTTGRTDPHFLAARNTLTQRTIGPESSGATAVDLGNMKDGDFAGLALLQRQYGLVGVKSDGGTNFVVMVSAQSNSPVEVARVPVSGKTVYLRADCDFKNRTDQARFSYSLDGKTWTSIGSELKMNYTLPHFMGYRFGLFNFATKEAGGFADFDYFRIADHITASNNLPND
jgi:beta-xylosidase